MRYKRNQVEEAIAQAIGEKGAKPSSALLTRMKRLMNLDRLQGRNRRSNRPEQANFAFYTDEAPGKGVEVEFTDYEAFALQTSLRLLHHGWPQTFAVETLRGLRPEMEPEHTRILRMDPAKLFNEEAILKNAKEGAFAIDNTNPSFLVIASLGPPDSRGNQVISSSVCESEQKVGEFVRDKAARSWTMFELVTPAHTLRQKLSEIQPRKRGRGSE